MAQQQAPDDIFALFSRFDLDMSQYRVFNREPRSPALESQTVTEAGAETLSPIPEPLIDLNKQDRPIPITPAQTDVKIPERAGLHNLHRSLRESQDRSMVTSSTTATKMVSFSGSSGGVGVTTIMATLARQFSRSGQRCGLVDGAPDSLVPLFFGVQKIADHQGRFAALNSVLTPTIRLIGPDAFPNLTDVHQGGEAALLDNLGRRFSSELDYLLLDQARARHDLSNGLNVFVALPDVGSVLSVRTLINKRHWPKQRGKTVCVLNRFDPAVALHQELLAWYRDHFDHVFPVHHSFLIPEALAEGSSVLDWAPNSVVAEDFTRLSDYLIQMSALLQSRSTADHEEVTL